MEEPRTELGRVVAAYLGAAARYVAARDRLLAVPPGDPAARATAELAWLEAEQDWAAVRVELDRGFWLLLRVAVEQDPEALARHLAPVVDGLLAEPVRTRLLKAEERMDRLEAEAARLGTMVGNLARAIAAEQLAREPVGRT